MPTINLMNAYMIETLRSKGLDNDTLITAIHEKDIQPLIEWDDSYDYAHLIDSANGKESVYEQAIRESYSVSYLTIGGLRNLLKLKFGFEEDKDYSLSEKELSGLTVSLSQLEVIQELVGSVWIVKEVKRTNDSIVIDIHHGSLIGES